MDHVFDPDVVRNATTEKCPEHGSGWSVCRCQFAVCVNGTWHGRRLPEGYCRRKRYGWAWSCTCEELGDETGILCTHDVDPGSRGLAECSTCGGPAPLGG